MKTVTTILVVTLLTMLPVFGQENPAPDISLHMAALQGNVEVIRQHIKAGTDLNEKDAFGSTPLIVATTFDKTEAARLLIEAGADICKTAFCRPTLYVPGTAHGMGYLAVDQKALLQSVTKSFTSALVGIALDQGCLSSVNQNMMDFFPEFYDQITDPRKKQIAIRDMLQMRAGYPWEETDPALFEILYSGFRLSHLIEFPLTSDPGTAFQYSNLTSHLLGVIVTRACDTDLRSFAQEYLFSAIDVEVGDWVTDWDGYYIGNGGLRFTARDAARFGMLYLNDGEYEGNQVVPAD